MSLSRERVAIMEFLVAHDLDPAKILQDGITPDGYVELCVGTEPGAILAADERPFIERSWPAGFPFDEFDHLLAADTTLDRNLR
ncbi:hypothetical protein MRBLMI12_000442 [Microbacterium sp. LMI12-1-1.1]|uniref:hypothetical protein n=1 Tax=Microbacterium sp. LMI12-1-1.1 TaxID=3135225 RepID=UPI0034494222